MLQNWAVIRRMRVKTAHEKGKHVLSMPVPVSITGTIAAPLYAEDLGHQRCVNHHVRRDGVVTDGVNPGVAGAQSYDHLDRDRANWKSE